MAEVEFLFDYGSPASYLAYARVPGIAARTGATIRYQPILLGGVFKATGNHSPADIPAKRVWLDRDMKLFAERYGVPFVQNPFFPINTLLLMRGAVAADLQGRLVPYSDAMFRAIWVEARNMQDPQIVGGLLAEAGFDPHAMLAATEDPAVKARLREATDTAVRRGVFGAPTFFVGGELFWGQDRLDFVEAALKH
ncbi:2-hydroxychromene-2-carboxylate isomerase [Rhizobiales bacterium GAS191]|nr:2-hydroxychromene-2-carboxylate isomerase [Rhizobiales bacterium GAS191]